MRFKLRFKIFTFSIILIFCLLISIICSLVVANQKFENDIKLNEYRKVSFLGDALTNFYNKNGGWGKLIKNTDLWDVLLEQAWLEENNVLSSQKRAIRTDDVEVTLLRYKRGDLTVPIWDQLDMGPRICLFDRSKTYVIGQTELPIGECTLIPINLSGEVIGWLALKKSQTTYQPLNQVFGQNQFKTLFIMSSLFLIILIFIITMFSKHIVKPITQLAEATNKLGHLNFNTRIPVKTSDEIGQLAGNFNYMAEKLEAYERNQKQWLSDISHELRTPLSVLICEIDALKDGIRKPDNVSLVSLSSEARHLIKLVNDIHDISMIEAATFSMKKQPLKLLPILSQELYIFQKRFESNVVSMEVELDQTANDLKITGDSDRLKQLFSNILENAIRYTKKPGRLIIRQTHDADWIKIAFEDSGPGVPDEALPLLFNRLYRVNSARSRKTGGSGLGLAICKSIVEMHDGKISARNIQGGGLMIEILLPLESNSRSSIELQADNEKQVNLK
jgi:two-component system, OmpR family, sensor histidine kinase BaeS